MKQLFLIRHAKSSLEDPQIADTDRTLTDQGQQQAKDLAEKLKENKIKPDLILCSSATRAQQTAALIAKGLDVAADKIQVKPILYEENIGLLLDVIKAIPNHEQCVMIIAHNPTLSWLATYLSNNEHVSLATCGMFAMQFNMIAWRKITEVEGDVLEIC